MSQQYFGQISPTPITNQTFRNISFKSCFESIPTQKKTVSDVLKMWYFPYSAFWSTGQWGGISLPSDYPTAAKCFAFFDSCLLPLGSRSRRHLPRLRLRPQTFSLETEANFKTTSLTLKFYPQKLQKLFCPKMRFLMFEQRQPISFFCAQLFANKLFGFQKKKMPHYAVTHLNFWRILSTWRLGHNSFSFWSSTY